MLATDIDKTKLKTEKRRIKISSKRQITIPAKYFDSLGMGKELDCIYSNNMLILLPVKNEDSAFSEEILKDLIQQGFSGDALLSEFKKANRRVRPAVEAMIAEADRIAEAAMEQYVDRTGHIFVNEDADSYDETEI